MIDYIVQFGDTIYSIAREYNITPERLRLANPDITDMDSIVAGQKIRIPDSYKMHRIIEVNGYAYANIDRQVLLNTLPYLTYLGILNYQVRPDGSLVDIDDTPLIQISRQAGVAPMMVITNTDDSGAYSSEVAHAILTDMQAQQTLMNNAIAVMQSKNYYGLDVDFEYIDPVDFFSYGQFIQTFSVKLHPLGYIIASSVRIRVLAEQQQQLTEAANYSVIGSLIDRFILMTSECVPPPRYGSSIAPIDQVNRALEYGVSVVPSQKILVGMPNYCYDWALRSQTDARVQLLSLTQAEALAARTGAVIQYDPGSQAPYFEYMDELGIRHIVWFDDVVSVRASLELVETYNLGGVSFWTIDLFSMESYQALVAMYDVRKVLPANMMDA